MKKVVSILIIVLLMFGSGVCGFFINNAIPARVYSIDEAKEIIGKVAHTANFVKDDSTSSTMQVASASDYESYSGTTIDYDGKEAIVKTFVSMLYYAVDGDVSPNTYYISTAKHGTGSDITEGEMTFYFELTETEAHFYITDTKNDITMVMVVSAEDNTEGSYQIEGYVTSLFDTYEGLVYFVICTDNEKVTRFACNEIAWTIGSNRVHDKNIDVNKDIRGINIFDCNLLTNTRLKISEDDISNEEVMEYVSETVKKFYEIDFDDVVYKDFKEVGFLANAYKNLGYNVIE